MAQRGDSTAGVGDTGWRWPAPSTLHTPIPDIDDTVRSVITDWNGYFTAQAGAFAALTGLVFVALSNNLKKILESPGLPGRAGEAVILLVEPVLIGLLGLLPHQARARSVRSSWSSASPPGWRSPSSW